MGVLLVVRNGEIQIRGIGNVESHGKLSPADFDHSKRDVPDSKLFRHTVRGIRIFPVYGDSFQRAENGVIKHILSNLGKPEPYMCAPCVGSHTHPLESSTDDFVVNDLGAGGIDHQVHRLEIVIARGIVRHFVITVLAPLCDSRKALVMAEFLGILPLCLSRQGEHFPGQFPEP